MIASRVVYALLIIPPGGMTYWYSRRLEELKDARQNDDGSPEAMQRHDQLERRVNLEGILAILGLLSYYLLLSIIL